jgi:hypothetical protein
MIAKKVPNPGGGGGKAARVNKLADYITEPQLTNGFEKCVESGAENFITSTFEGHKSEMIALAQESTKSKDPIDHWVLSFRSGEHPTPEQVKQAVEIFIAHCGLNGHQYIFGMHDDTKNKHVHIMVNRVNPVTLRVTKINKGFDREAAQQAIALIEHAQGWQKEANARYNIVNGKPVLSEKGAIAKNNGKPLEPSSKAKDMEVQTGEKSAERIGIETAAPIIKSSNSWKELHERLAAHGMKYERKGSGAMVYVCDIAIKASAVDRAASLSAMQKRLGTYQPAQEINRHDYFNHTPEPHAAALGENTRDSLRNLSECRLAYGQEGKETRRTGVLQIDARTGRPGTGRLRREPGFNRGAGMTPQPMRQNQPGWKEYIMIRDAQNEAQIQATAAMQKRHDVERQHLYAKLKNERYSVLGGNWKNRGSQRNEIDSVLAISQAADKRELNEKHKFERQQLREMYRPIPQYKAWLEESSIVCTNTSSVMIEEEWEVRKLRNLRLAKLLISMLRNLTYSVDSRGHVTYKSDDKELFRDEGRRIAMIDTNSDLSIAAALVVGQQKFGKTLILTGPVEFQNRAVAVAVQHNIQVTFADSKLEALRERLLAEKRQAERDVTLKIKLTTQMISSQLIEQQVLQVPVEAAMPKAEEVFVMPVPINVPITAQEWAEFHMQETGKILVPFRPGVATVLYLDSDSAVLVTGNGINICKTPPNLNLKTGQTVVIGEDETLKIVKALKKSHGITR